MRIGYLVSEYPALSHTFIRREIEELRLKGLVIDTFSIKLPLQANLISEQDHAAFDETFYLFRASILVALTAHGLTLAKRPMAYARMLRTALLHRPPGLHSLYMSLIYFAGAAVLARELERRGIDHLHNHFANSAAIVGMLAAQLLDLPWSFTLHGVSETDYPAGLLLGAKIEVASFVACVSYFGRAQALRTVAPKYWPKLFVSHCGIRMRDLPAHKERPVGAPVRMICVARLSPEKAHSGLLQAFARFRDQGGKGELVLVGDGPDHAAVEQIIRDLGLEENVHLIGRLNEQDTLVEIAASDVLVISSLMEGLPVVLIEAMALGLPVIASHVAGIPELVEPNRNGLLFPPTDWDALADCMLTLASDKGLRERLGGAGPAKIAAEFAIERAVQPIYDRFAGTVSKLAPLPLLERAVNVARAR